MDFCFRGHSYFHFSNTYIENDNEIEKGKI